MVFEEIGVMERILQEVRAGAEKNQILRDVNLPAATVEVYLALLDQGKFIGREGARKPYSLTAKGVRCLWVFEELSEAYFSKDAHSEGEPVEEETRHMSWNKREIVELMKDIIEP